MHAHGSVRLQQGVAWIRRHVGQLSESQESGRPKPWKIEDAPAEFIDKLVGAIIGMEIPVERLVGKRKVSQNQAPRDGDGRQGGTPGPERVRDS